MIPAPVLLVVAKATLVLVVALGLARGLQRGPAGARHLVWLATLGALLLVPALDAWAPLRLAVLPAAPAAVTAVAPVAGTAVAPTTGAMPAAEGLPHARPATGAVPSNAAPNDDAGQPAPAAAPNASVGAAAWAARFATDVVPVALAVWAVVALAIGGSLAHAWLALRRIVRRARPLDTSDWLDPLWEVSDRLGLDEPPRLLRSEDAKMPFACGVRRPTIVLPAASDGWTLDRRRAVLLHELAHVRRRDLAGHTLARLVCAVYWFHPLVWTAAKRLRAESERACDDLALACGARAADYAEHLLDIVTSVRRDRTPLVALAMARHSEFEGRLLAILDAERSRVAPSLRQRASLVGGLALVTVLVGAAAPVPTTHTDAATPAIVATPAVAAAPAVAATATPPALVEHDAQAPASPRARVQPRESQAREAALLDGRVARPPAPRVVPRAAPAVVPGGRAAADTAGGRTAGSAVEAAAEAVVGVAAPNVTAAPGAERARATALAAIAARPSAAAGTERSDERAELLARVLRSDTSASLRRIAAWGLAEYAELPTASTALAGALRRDPNAAVREMAAWALADGRGADARDALGAALRADAEVKVRATAAWALGNVGDRASVDALTAALRDPSVQVRTRAVWALGNVEPRQAPAPLVAMLGDGDPEVRELTAWALYNIEDPAAVPALQAALRAERDTELQVAYIRALAALGEQSVGALRGLLESPDARVKAITVRALAGRHAAGPWPRPWPQPRPFP